MIDLARHIEILLLDNDCVIVPGFGGFMTHHIESCYNEEEQLFFPPSRTLGFNPQLQVNDSLLAQSYVEAYDISYPEAIQRIEDDVREIRKTLSNEGVFELNNIGIIKVNEEGNYIFEPCSAGVLTPSLYALTSFSMPIFEKNAVNVIAEEKIETCDTNNSAEESQAKVVSLIPEVEEKNSENNSEPEEATITVAEEAAENVEDEIEDETTNKKVITISINALRNTAVAIMLLLVAVVTTLHFGIKNTDVQQAGLDTGLLQKIMPQMKTTPVKDINKKIYQHSSKIKKTDSKVSEPKTENQEIKAAKAEPQENWVIVLASHVSGKNAELYIDQLKKDGIGSARMIRKGHKIVCGSFDSESDAHSYIKVLQGKSSHCQDCWITKIEE